MRTSLNDIAAIERYLTNDITSAEKLAVRERIQQDFYFRMNLFLQRKVYALLRRYFRLRVRNSAEAVHTNIFNDPSKPSYCQNIHFLFNKK